jgi:DNA polymerase III sliding clamp (beta) subunit (PCNA family)
MKDGVITAKAATRLSRDAKAKRLVILAVDDDGNWTYATAGKPGGDDEAIAKWALRRAPDVIADMADATRTAPTIEHFREALTPSGETKAEYIGEFSMSFPEFDDDGDEVTRTINVPWVTIKEIMNAITARANRLAGHHPDSETQP